MTCVVVSSTRETHTSAPQSYRPSHTFRSKIYTRNVLPGHVAHTVVTSVHERPKDDDQSQLCGNGVKEVAEKEPR